MLFIEKISNVKLKREYTELLFFVDEKDDVEGYNPGDVCSLRIDHRSEIFNMSSNKNLLIAEIMKLQTINTITEIIEYLNNKGFIYSISVMTKSNNLRRNEACGISNSDTVIDVDAIYDKFGHEDFDEENVEDEHVSDKKLEKIVMSSMYGRFADLERAKNKVSEPEEDELSLNIVDRYADFKNYLK